MSTRTLLGVLTLLTLSHLGIRTASGDGAPISISSLSGGDTVEGAFFGELEAEWPPAVEGACLAVVAFDPSCPVTRTAAFRRRNSGIGAEAPVLWLANEDRPEVLAFGEQLPAGDRLLINERAFGTLHVDAVPAAFLVRRDSTLARVWPFTGRETAKDLKGWCPG